MSSQPRCNPRRTARTAGAGATPAFERGLALDGGGAPVGLAAKKESLHAQEQDSEQAQQRRQAWREEVAAIAVERLVFLDESGSTTQMTRTRGRAPRGERVCEATPQGHWKILTMVAALTTRGLKTPMTIAEATNGDIFLAYVDQVG